MKLVKPMVVSFSFRTFLMLGKQHLSVTSLIGFALDARRLVSEIVLWPAIGKATGGVVDEGLPKARGEVLVYGSCHTPGGVPLPASHVRVRVASASAPPGAREAAVDKTLAVMGDRYWQGSASRDAASPVPSSGEATAPIPFSQMPLGWERAFGGPSFPRNPHGRGIDRLDVGGGVWRVALPNVELASTPVTTSSQRLEPAGLGPLDVSWPQRQSKAGTYDGRWLEEDFPGYARDTDPAFFSTAPPDQRINGFFRGDEEYVLENMHPSRPVIHGRLPGVGARVLVRRKGGTDVEDIRTRLDTLVFLPEANIGIAIFRGMTPVLEDDAADIPYALAACEEFDAPRSIDHYREALDSRLDKDKSARLALKEDDLVPPFAAGSGLAELMKSIMAPDAADDRSKAMRERTMARVRKELVEAGVDDPDEALARARQMPAGLEPLAALLPLPDFSDPKAMAAFDVAMEKSDAAVAAYMETASQKSLEAAREAVADARREGVSLPEHLLEPGFPQPGPGPPVPQAPRTLAMFREDGIEPDPTLAEKLHKADASALEMYRGAAHYMAPVAALPIDARSRSAVAAREIRALGKSFASLDCTRYDLSSLDLQGADFRETLLEGADLTRTNFAGANLCGAVLAHAVLQDTCFDGATLERTNLGGAELERASLVGANLRGATLARAKLRSASLRGADLTGVDWLEAELGAVDFEGAVAPGIDFFPGSDLTGCRFSRAKLTKANVIERNLDGVDFAEADLELVTFLTVKANGANFRKACMRKFHAVVECSFEGASFEGADLTGAFLRGSNLRGANFEGACLQGADLSECDLTGAKLSGVQARELLLVRADLTNADLRGANLMEGMLQKSKLHGADLSRTNLFAANLGLVRLDTATKVKDANLKRALMLPKVRR